MFTAACLLELVVGKERREREGGSEGGDAVGVQKRKEGILTGAIWSHLVLISSYGTLNKHVFEAQVFHFMH